MTQANATAIYTLHISLILTAFQSLFEFHAIESENRMPAAAS